MGDDYEIRFSDLTPEGEEVNVRTLRQSTVMKCPHYILVPEHYRVDGTCRCDDPEHKVMRSWGYRWDGRRWA